MIPSANINLIKIKNQPFKKVTGWKEKMKNLLDLLEKMELDNGVKLPLHLMLIWVPIEMESSVEKDGSIF